VVTIDRAGAISSFNPAAERLFERAQRVLVSSISYFPGL
jgi:hypothetical protein